jgi:hypothetical protein
MPGETLEHPRDWAAASGNRWPGNAAEVFTVVGLGRVVGIRRSVWDKLGTSKAVEAYHGAAVVSRQSKCSVSWESRRSVDQCFVTV